MQLCQGRLHKTPKAKVGDGWEDLSIRQRKAQKNQVLALNNMASLEWEPVAEAEGKVLGEITAEWEQVSDRKIYRGDWW